MKKLLLFLIVVLLNTNIFSDTKTITNVGLTFSPSTINVNVGDTVVFSIDNSHTARQVSQTTWNANGITQLSGGFDLPFGGGTVVLNTPGTVFYVCVPHASLGMKGTIIVNTVTEVEELSLNIPNKYILLQNYPNPFNPSTKIRFGLISESKITLKIYNSLGQEVRELINNVKPAGFYEINFDANNLASGIYFYRLTALSNDNKTSFIDTKKLILLK